MTSAPVLSVTTENPTPPYEQLRIQLVELVGREWSTRCPPSPATSRRN
jgi:hypothetical protein